MIQSRLKNGEERKIRERQSMVGSAQAAVKHAAVKTVAFKVAPRCGTSPERHWLTRRAQTFHSARSALSECETSVGLL
jgi:hypothetical protein